MTPEEQSIQNDAMKFARSEKNRIARRLTDLDIYAAEKQPVSVFMAGSPGAGKTEASIELINSLKHKNSDAIIRIDPDELRCEFPTYSGGNAWLYQGAVSILVNRTHDLALDQSQSFVLDGTLSRYEQAERNIERSLKKRRQVQILYVYQKPELAWHFVTAREALEGRQIKPEVFTEQYFAARDVVNRLKVQFGKNIQVDLLLKNNDNSGRTQHFNVSLIDKFIPEHYSREDVEKLVSQKLRV